METGTFTMRKFILLLFIFLLSSCGDRLETTGIICVRHQMQVGGPVREFRSPDSLTAYGAMLKAARPPGFGHWPGTPCSIEMQYSNGTVDLLKCSPVFYRYSDGREVAMNYIILERGSLYLSSETGGIRDSIMASEGKD